MWNAAGVAFYEHLRDTTKEGKSPTLSDLAPLYQAIAHGCRAGLRHMAPALAFCAATIFAAAHSAAPSFSLRSMPYLLCGPVWLLILYGIGASNEPGARMEIFTRVSEYFAIVTDSISRAVGLRFRIVPSA